MSKDKKTESKKVEKRKLLKKVNKRTTKKGFMTKKKYFFLVILLFVIGVGTWVFWGLPLPSQLGNEQFAVSTKILDRNGKLIYEIFDDQRRTPVALTDIPDHVKKATIAIEDKDFYKHSGFSIMGIGRAVKRILFEQRVQGGSTITQQLVKNTLLSNERTVRRKIREIALSIVVESMYSKDKILEMYLNQIPYGGTAYGVEAASQNYLGKATKDLTLAEASYLAGLPAAPSRYSPFGARPELAKERQRTVLDSMVRDGYITEDDANKAYEEEIKLKEPEDFDAPHFSLWVKEQLAEKYGERQVEQGGLRVTTSLDLDLQKYAEEVVATEVGRLKNQKVGNGAALVTKPETGEILAMVGSKGYFAEDEDGKVNIIFAERQPGSSIKPLNYALAIQDKKITASTPLADIATCFTTLGQAPYCPVNYDGGFHGPQQTRFSLGNSYNIPAVRALALNGVPHFIDYARSLGITTFNDPDRYGLSLTLGGGEVMPYDMATAFGTFANGGIRQPLISILKVEDWKGNVLDEVDIEEVRLSGERVMEPAVPFIVSHMLLDNNARVSAFGERSFLNVSGHSEVSVKTGTTNDRRDNWTIGYTQDALVVVWVGNNDNTAMSGAVSGVSGASPIWNRIIKKTLDDYEREGHGWQEQPDDVIGTNICTTSGNVPTEGSPDAGCPTRFEYFLKDAIGAKLETGRKDVQIDKTNGGLAGDKTPPENIETQNHAFLLDPLGTLMCLDCPSASASATIGYPLKTTTSR